MRVLVAVFVLGRAAIRRWSQILELVLQMKNDQVAWAHAEVGRFPARAIGEAVTDGAVGLRYVIGSQIGLEDAVTAAEVFRLTDDAASLWPRAYASRCLLSTQPVTRECEA